MPSSGCERRKNWTSSMHLIMTSAGCYLSMGSWRRISAESSSPKLGVPYRSWRRLRMVGGLSVPNPVLPIPAEWQNWPNILSNKDLRAIFRFVKLSCRSLLACHWRSSDFYCVSVINVIGTTKNSLTSSGSVQGVVDSSANVATAIMYPAYPLSLWLGCWILCR